jgi:hypothetical protein
VPEDKHLVRHASWSREDIRRQITNRADHKVVAHEDRGPLDIAQAVSDLQMHSETSSTRRETHDESERDRDEKSSNETFDGFLGAQLDELMATKHHS